MNPLTPDHHFYIDQGTNARLRLLLIAIGRKLVEGDTLDDPEDVMFLRYNELRLLMADQGALRRPRAGRRPPRRPRGRLREAPALVGGHGHSDRPRLPLQRPVGLPGEVPRGRAGRPPARCKGLAASAGVVEGLARYVKSLDEFDQVKEGEILVCNMTNPAWVVLFTKISGLVTEAGGAVSHPAVVAREFGIPAVVGTTNAGERDRHRRPRAGERHHRRGRDSRSRLLT